MRPRALTFAFVLVTTALAAFGERVCHAAEGDRPRARLVYTHEPALADCPSDREVRDAVAARLGYDPFADAATLAVNLDIVRRAKGIEGTVSFAGPAQRGQRVLPSPSGDCRALVDALAVAMALGIDPSSDERPPGTPPPLPPPPPPAPIAPPPPAPDADRAPPPPANDPTKLRVGAGLVALFGETPSATGGVALSVGVRRGALEALLEGDATLPSRIHATGGAIGGGRISGALYTVSVVPCFHVSFAFACATGTLGAFHGEGTEVATPMTETLAYAAVGLRGGIEVPIFGRFHARAALDGVVPLTRFTLQLGGQDVWTTPVVAARAGVSAGADF